MAGGGADACSGMSEAGDDEREELGSNDLMPEGLVGDADAGDGEEGALLGERRQSPRALRDQVRSSPRLYVRILREMLV